MTRRHINIGAIYNISPKKSLFFLSTKVMYIFEIRAPFFRNFLLNKYRVYSSGEKEKGGCSTTQGEG